MEYLLYSKVAVPRKDRVHLSARERKALKIIGVNPPKEPIQFRYVLQKRIRTSPKCRIAGSIDWAKSICPSVVKVIAVYSLLLLPFIGLSQTNITAEEESIIYTVERYIPNNTVEYSLHIVKTLKDILKTIPVQQDYIITFNGEEYQIEYFYFSGEYEVYNNNRKILELTSFSQLKAELISMFYFEITGKSLYLNE